MPFTQENKQELIKKLQLKRTDTGSVEVQVGILTGRINGLADHF